MTAIMAPIAGRLADRYPAGILGGLGLSLFALGLLLVAFLPDHATMPDFVWRMAVCGFGFGLFNAPNNRAMIVAVRDKVAGLIQKGMTAEQVVAAKPTADFDAKVPGATAMTADRFVGQLYAETAGGAR